MTVPMNASTSQDVAPTPRPKDVGILAMEMYFPQRVRGTHFLICYAF